MRPQKIDHHTQAHQFEPLMPGHHRIGPLLERAGDLVQACTRLAGPATQLAQGPLPDLLRRMNSYYTNRLEGQNTRPSEIERALHEDYSRNTDLARRQRLAVAHIATELTCENSLDAAGIGPETIEGLYAQEPLRWLHGQLFSSLADGDLLVSDGSRLKPGEFRARQVAVGRHEAPHFQSIPTFLDRWANVYGHARRGEAAIVAATASHHRLAWIHPFVDGNGRVARLHTHLVLRALGLTAGVWSPLRAFARSEDRYKALLAAADEHRRGDLDGRGNLTEQGLVDWISYCLDIFQDQARFMVDQLDIRGMRDRIAAALAFEKDIRRSGVRIEALGPLHYLFGVQGALSRAEFKAMTGLGERNATALVSALLAQGFLESDSPYGDVRFGIPAHALRFYFPALWPEAEQERSQIDADRSP